MEACFLTSSRSFINTKDVVPYTKARVFSYPKRYSTLFHYRKAAASPYSIRCCRWTPMDDEDEFKNKRLSDEADWRSFRARLVSGEGASRPEDSSLQTSPDTVVDYPQRVLLDDKWAHPIYEPEKGCLLIATEKLNGVHIFERTVILLLSVGPVGPFGIILNRPSLMSIKETKSTVLDMSGTFSDKRLFFGGPLEDGIFLVSPKGGDGEVRKNGIFKEVVKGLYYGSKESVGLAAEMVKRNVVGTSEFRFFDGYCGWERDQLDEEILAGYWTVAACSPSVIGLGRLGSHGLWDEILGLMGRKKVV